MIVFGIDVPLVEILLLFLIVSFILLLEGLVLISLLIRELNKARARK